MSPLLSLLVPAALAANPMGAGVAIREVAAPPTLVSGIASISVGKISGQVGGQIAAELKAGLADDEREVGRGTAADIAGDVVEMGAMVGGQMLASKLGGFGGKATNTVAQTAGAIAADKVRGDKLTLEDGLTVAPFPFKESGGKGVLAGSTEVDHKDERYKKEVELKDKDGNVVKDAEGRSVMTEVSCLKRTVTASLDWAVTAGGKELATGEQAQTMSDDKCGADVGDILSVDDIAASAARGMGHSIVAEIKPAWRSYRVGLKRAKHLAAPLRATRLGAHDQALCLFHHMTGLDPEDGVAKANLGAMHEVLGHHDEAIAAYAAAAEAGGPKRLATKGQERVEARKTEVAGMVEAYGLTWGIAAPDLAACPALPEGSPKLVKKPLTTTVDGNEIEVEKGETVFLQSEEGGTAKVLLIDGTPVEMPTKSLR